MTLWKLSIRHEGEARHDQGASAFLRLLMIVIWLGQLRLLQCSQMPASIFFVSSTNFAVQTRKFRLNVRIFCVLLLHVRTTQYWSYWTRSFGILHGFPCATNHLINNHLALQTNFISLFWMTTPSNQTLLKMVSSKWFYEQKTHGSHWVWMLLLTSCRVLFECVLFSSLVSLLCSPLWRRSNCCRCFVKSQIIKCICSCCFCCCC